MKSFKIIITIFTIILISGCSEDWLEVPIIGKTLDDNYYQGQPEADKAVIAAYSALRYADGSGFHGPEFFNDGEAMSDNAEVGGRDLTEAFSRDQIKIGIVNPSDEFAANVWTTAYLGIHRANIVLEKVPGMVIELTVGTSTTDENPKGYNLAKRYMSEVSFIRAYCYFELVRYFGGVPLVTKSLVPSEYSNTPRGTLEETYKLIEDDLKYAISGLPKKSEYTAGDMGRITIGAAQAMLAKVYLLEEKWSEAAEMAKAVIESGEYDLNTPYSKIFMPEGENSSESVFEIQFKTTNTADVWHTATTGNTFYSWMRSRNSKWPVYGMEGWGWCVPTQNLVNEFENDDPRKFFTVVTDGEVDTRFSTKQLFTGNPADANAINWTGFTNKKYILPQSGIVGTPNFSDAPVNLRVIRYSDVLLTYAEASFHAGNEGEARSAVNQVRERARNEATDPSTTLPDVTASGSELLKAIKHERRVELAMEGHRFWDLVRWGEAQEVIGNFLANDAYTKTPGVIINTIFPIPKSQVDISNGSISQNPPW